MRLIDLARLAGRRGATSYMQKRGFAIPASLAVGAMLPGQVAEAIRRYEDIEQSMNRAAGEPLDPTVATKQAGWADVLKGLAGKTDGGKQMPIYAGKPGPTGWISPPGPTMGGLGGQVAGQLLGAMLKPIVAAPAEGIAERLKGVFAPKPPGPLQQIQQQATETLGRSIGEAGAGLVRDIASKALSAIGGVGAQSARVAIVQTLKAEDPILAEADNDKLLEAYHTMVRFAPVLSTDKNAVRSFLRQAVMTGAGPDYASIKLLADSERAVTGGGGE